MTSMMSLLYATILSLAFTTEDEILHQWLDRKLLPADEARQMLPKFVERQLEPLPLPETIDAWKSRRDSLREEILQIVGLDDLLPAQWDLNIHGPGVIERDEYRIEKFTYESYPGFANAALLYVPKNITGRMPGIISISGHTPDSKAAAYIQQRNINLALRGCVVLCYDYFGYGDRKTGDFPYPTGSNGHHHRHFSYSRRCATTLEILDGVRALDVLCQRPEVDPERIGFTGESGGSNSTYWIAALDPRVKLAVPACSVTTFAYWIRGDINWDWHQRPPGIRRVAEIGTLLALHAPHPLVIVSSRRGTDDDEFPLHEAENSYQWARHVYELYGAGDQAQHYESRTGHGFQEDKREELYRAVERWLSPPRPRDGKEQPVILEAVEDLRCGLPNNKTFQSIFQEWVADLPCNELTDPDQQRKFLRKRLGWPEMFPDVVSQRIDQKTSGDWNAEFWIIDTEPGIRLPVIVIGPRDQPDSPVTLIPGRDLPSIHRALKSGQRVVTFDLRAIGETQSGQGGHWSSMAGEPWSKLLASSGHTWGNWSWFAGRPVPGQWAYDTVQIAKFSARQFGTTKVSIQADADFGWPSLLAGAAMPELISKGSITLRKESLTEELQSRGERALADVPGLLQQLDLRQIRKLWSGDVRVVQ